MAGGGMWESKSVRMVLSLEKFVSMRKEKEREMWVCYGWFIYSIR
jgi:hypothetical protein